MNNKKCSKCKKELGYYEGIIVRNKQLCNDCYNKRIAKNGVIITIVENSMKGKKK